MGGGSDVCCSDQFYRLIRVSGWGSLKVVAIYCQDLFNKSTVKVGVWAVKCCRFSLMLETSG